MRIIKKNTKRAEYFWREYTRGTEGNIFDIFDAYKRPSYFKERAWRDCVRICEELGGIVPIISSYCSTHFVVMFRTHEGDLYKITKDNIYKVPA